MGIIFDSCIWIGLASGQIDRQSIITISNNKPIFTSAISLGELSLGMESCIKPSDRAIRASYLCQIEGGPILNVSKKTASAFGILAAAVKQLARSARPRYNDLWIAAQAIEYGYTLLTLNTNDFADLPRLQLITLKT